MSLLLLVFRHTFAMIAFIATFFVTFFLVMGPRWGYVYEMGPALGISLLVLPVAFLLLALDYAFFRTNAGFKALGLNYHFPTVVKVLAPLLFAVMGFLPYVLFHFGITGRTNWWLFHSPLWISVLVHRVIMIRLPGAKENATGSSALSPLRGASH
jgi:hypothetical protein